MDLASRLHRNPQVEARPLAEGQGGVLLHKVSGQYHGVNPVGLAIWELIDDGSTVGDVADRLRERVEQAPPNLEEDVLRFVASIHERDLLTAEP